MGTTDAVIDAVRDALAPVIAGLGLELYDVELQGAGGARTLRVTVDRPGGVDIDAIAEVTKLLSPMLDDARFSGLSGSYLLEVSSPGIERALRTPAHYAAAVGSPVSVKLRTADGTRRVRGNLVDAGSERCTVDCDGTREEVAYVDVTQARTVFEWTAPPRPGGPRSDRAGAGTGTRASKGAGA